MDKEAVSARLKAGWIKRRQSIPDPKIRLMGKVRYTPYGCWEWTDYINPAGYGHFSVGRGGDKLAHRWSYRFFVGDIANGTELDHLCRNRCCVNPDHLEAVTRQVNSQRGVGGHATGSRQRAKTHCRNGHPYSGDNLYLYPNGDRGCRTCNRAAQARYEERKKEMHHGRPI